MDSREKWNFQGSIRFKKDQDCSERFNMIQGGSARFNGVQEVSEVSGRFKNFQAGDML